MANCKECEIINSLDNAWRALFEHYENTCDEQVRIALNLIAKFTNKVKADFTDKKKREEPHQITIEEWLNFINNEV